MAGLSQSAFLQALGWATLNSFWQMALLWCVFAGANYFFNFSASKKYFFSVIASIAGGIWFITTFLVNYNTHLFYSFAFTDYSIPVFKGMLPLILTASSVSYLLLLFIPAYKLLYNWRKVQFLRNNGLQKAEINYKLFVKKISSYLGIKKNVCVYFSEIVKSPLTIGYLKPIILLPLASINNLTVHQIEAVLLHELSHIKRFDYLINILISIIHTLLYFNPFTRLFIKIVQEERENCCDQMVLQFGYDKVSYASALLSLEKTSLQSHAFVLAAAGKRNLLGRIEKIIGIEKKIVFQFNHFIAILAGILCIFTFNSFLVISKEKDSLALSFNNLSNPFYFFGEKELTPPIKKRQNQKGCNSVALVKKFFETDVINVPYSFPQNFIVVPPQPQIVPAAYNEAAINLSKEQEEHIEATIENTKKVLSTYQWNEVEKSIGDGLNPLEKAAVKKEYLQELKNIDWKKMENGLKEAYQNINWPEIDANIKTALITIHLDSLQNIEEETLKTIEKVQTAGNSTIAPSPLPFPDESVNTLKKHEEDVRNTIQKIKLIRTRKIIKL